MDTYGQLEQVMGSLFEKMDRRHRRTMLANVDEGRKAFALDMQQVSEQIWPVSADAMLFVKKQPRTVKRQ